MEVLGFHTIDENLFTENDYSFTETYYDAQNFLNILGWFPGLGTVIGSIRIGSTIVMWISNDKTRRSSHKKYFIVSILRGVVEIIGLGWLFVIPDIMVTLTSKRRFKRLRKWKPFKGSRKKINSESISE